MGLKNRLPFTYASLYSMLDSLGWRSYLAFKSFFLLASAHLPDNPLHRVEAVYIHSLYLNESRCILVRTKIRK